MPAPLPVNILSGYLGAGKTTLLNRLLNQHDQRILVMVNDFGDIAVDAAMIARRAPDLIHLSNGCMCCALGGDLFKAFERALGLRNRVDRLVIEASGVAEPARLARFAMAERDLLCQSVLTVVEPLTLASRLADPRIGKVVRRQIEGADLLYLSRGDVAGRAALRQTARALSAINPLAGQHRAVGPALFGELHTPHDFRALSSGNAGPGDHQALFARRTIRLDGPPGRDRLLAVLDRYRRHVHRLKGYLTLAEQPGPHLLQLAGGVVSLIPTEDPAEGLPLQQLVAIGLEQTSLDRLAAELTAA